MELIAVGLTLLVLDIGGAGAGHGMDWDGTLVFSEDFNGDALRNYYWESEEGCEGTECFFLIRSPHFNLLIGTTGEIVDFVCLTLQKCVS